MAQGENKWLIGAGMLTVGAVTHPTSKRWMRKAFVIAVQGVLEIKEQIHGAIALTREELEDIVAEARYIRSSGATEIDQLQKQEQARVPSTMHTSYETLAIDDRRMLVPDAITESAPMQKVSEG